MKCNLEQRQEAVDLERQRLEELETNGADISDAAATLNYIQENINNEVRVKNKIKQHQKNFKSVPAAFINNMNANNPKTNNDVKLKIKSGYVGPNGKAAYTVTYPNSDKEYTLGAHAIVMDNLDAQHSLPGNRLYADNKSADKSYEDTVGDKVLDASEINDPQRLIEFADELDKLDNVGISDSHRDHLVNVIKTITGTLRKPIQKMNVYLSEEYADNHGFIEFADKKGIYLKAGQNPSTMKTDMSLVEMFVHELIHGASHYGLNANKSELAREITLLTQLRSRALEELTPEDLLGDVIYTDAEYKIAEDRLNYMAEGERGLEEFLAMALSNEKVFNKLKTIKIREKKIVRNVGDSIYNALIALMDKIAALFGRDEKNMRGDKLVMKLVSDIGKLNHKAEVIRKEGLKANIDDTVDKFEEKFKDWVDGLEESNQKYILDKLAKGEKLGLIDKVRAIHFVLASEKGTPILQQLLAMLGLREEGFLQTIVKHVKHADKYGNLWQKLILMSDRIDSKREATAASTAKVINRAFGKKKLRTAQKKALYGAVMLADATPLVGEYSKAELKKLYSSKDVLNKQISNVEAQIREELSEADANHVLDQASGLADLMITGQSTIVQRKNAEAIAETAIRDGKVTPEIVAKIDMLTSMYATNMLDMSARKVMSDLVDNQYDGVKLVVATQKGFRSYVKEKYPEEAHNLMKNYHRETYDSEAGIEIAKVDTKTKNRLELEGYTFVKKVDALGLGYGDNIQLGLYVSPERTKRPMNRASLRYTGDREPGMSLWQDAFKRGLDTAVHDIVAGRMEQAALKALAYEDAVRAGKQPTKDTNVVPVVNADNVIIDYKTQVLTETKLAYMGLDTDTAQAVGRSFSHEADIEESKELNATVWDSLLDDMAENANSVGDIGKNGYRYVDITPLSNVSEVRDAARILPPEIREKMNMLKRVNVLIKNANTDSNEGADTKDVMSNIPKTYRKFISVNEVNGKFQLSDALLSEMIGKGKVEGLSNVKKDKLRSIFGKNVFKVRRDMLLDIFGVRDASIANLLPDHQMTKHLKKAIRILETAWREIVKIFKVDVIIRTLPVIIGNIISNFMYSWQYGLSPVAVAKKQLEGVMLLKEYLGNEAELAELIGKMAADPGNKRLQLKKKELESSMEVSPIRPLIDAGLYQHIVEDVNMDEFRSNNKISRFIDEKTEGAPELIKKGTQWLFITERTGLFQAVQSMTAYSDFVARYAQYTLGSKKEAEIINAKYDRMPSDNEEINNWNKKSNEYKEHTHQINSIESKIALLEKQVEKGVSYPDIVGNLQANEGGTPTKAEKQQMEDLQKSREAKLAALKEQLKTLKRNTPDNPGSKPKSKEERRKEALDAIDEQMIIRVRDAYVNYSKPDSKILQYMNDMGFVAFSKYAIRIQLGVQDLIKLKPLRFTLALIGQELFEAGTGYNPDDIGEISVLNREPTSWVFTPGFSKIFGDIIEPQMITHLKAITS